MPLFIDLHIDHNLTLDVVKQCHVADKAIQEKYGVKYLQILLNQPQGYLFCLAEAPDKESCARVHQEAHGNIACNILEITESEFSALLANKEKDPLDFTRNPDGSLDTGSRMILTVDLIGSVEGCTSAKTIVTNTFHERAGSNGESKGNRLRAIFNSCKLAIDTALAIKEKITDSALPVELRMGISVGLPLQEHGNFFEEASRMADRLSFISRNGQLTVSPKVMQLYHDHAQSINNCVKVINAADEKFLERVMTCVEKFWEESDMTVDRFSHEVGMSKSQLSRRLKALANFSPKDLIKEFRLRQSIHFILHDHLNVGEVTMAIGLSNPSYFTKCFRKRFGKTPSDYADH